MDACFAKLGMAYPSQRKHDCKRAHESKSNEGFFHFSFFYKYPTRLTRPLVIGNGILLNQGCPE